MILVHLRIPSLPRPGESGTRSLNESPTNKQRRDSEEINERRDEGPDKKHADWISRDRINDRVNPARFCLIGHLGRQGYDH